MVDLGKEREYHLMDPENGVVVPHVIPLTPEQQWMADQPGVLPTVVDAYTGPFADAAYRTNYHSVFPWENPVPWYHRGQTGSAPTWHR